MLGNHEIVAFVATSQPASAKDFYEHTLGLKLVEDSPAALVFDANGTMLRVQKVEKLQPAPFTAVGWHVPDIRTTVQGLAAKGVRFERYQGLPQDDLGIWTTPSGAHVAWFKDPCGNILSLTQFPRT